MMRQSGQFSQCWDHHMKKTDVDEIQHKAWENKWDSTEDGFKWKFRNILAQNYIIWMSCTILVAKHAPFMPMQSRNNDKIYSNSECKCSIAMIMMHPRDGWLQCQCNKMMDEMVHMTRCNCHNAGSMMHTPCCKDDNALDVCMYEMHKHDAHMHELMMHMIHTP